MRTAVVMVVAVITSGYGLVGAYKVEPVKAAWSGWALGDENHGVSQVVTCCWDDLDEASGSYVELFAGETLSGGYYKVDVYELPGSTNRVAYNEGEHATKPQSWVKMPLTMVSGKSFTKGKQYEFRFTRSGSDSIQYYYDEDCGYGPYGQMIAPYPPPSLTTGLAMRCFGRMRPVDSTYWGVEANLPWGGSAWMETWQDRAEDVGVGLARVPLQWRFIESIPDSYDFSELDRFYEHRPNGSCEALATAITCPRWAATAMESLHPRGIERRGQRGGLTSWGRGLE